MDYSVLRAWFVYNSKRVQHETTWWVVTGRKNGGVSRRLFSARQVRKDSDFLASAFIAEELVDKVGKN